MRAIGINSLPLDILKQILLFSLPKKTSQLQNASQPDELKQEIRIRGVCQGWRKLVSRKEIYLSLPANTAILILESYSSCLEDVHLSTDATNISDCLGKTFGKMCNLKSLTLDWNNRVTSLFRYLVHTQTLERFSAKLLLSSKDLKALPVVIKHNTSISEMELSFTQIGPSEWNQNSILEALSHNKKITRFQFEFTHTINTDQVANVLKQNRVLKYLCLRGKSNLFVDCDLHRIMEALEENLTLEYLQISINHWSHGTLYPISNFLIAQIDRIQNINISFYPHEFAIQFYSDQATKTTTKYHSDRDLPEDIKDRIALMIQPFMEELIFEGWSDGAVDSVPEFFEMMMRRDVVTSLTENL